MCVYSATSRQAKHRMPDQRTCRCACSSQLRPQGAGPSPAAPPPPPAPLKNCVCAVKMCDLHTPKTQPLLQDPKYLQKPNSKDATTKSGAGTGAAASAGSSNSSSKAHLSKRVAALTGRFTWHLPSLQGSVRFVCVEGGGGGGNGCGV